MSGAISGAAIPHVAPLMRATRLQALHCSGKRRGDNAGFMLPARCAPCIRSPSRRAGRDSRAILGAKGHGGQQRRDQARRRQLEPGSCRRDRRLPADAADQGGGAPLRRHGNLRRDPGERARRRRFRHAVDLVSGQRPSDGIADHHRRAAPRVGAAYHGGDPVFRLRPAGPQTGTAHADLGQARRQPDHPRRRRPGDDARSACRTDPGLLRHPDRQSLRLAGDGARHQGALRHHQGHGGVARRRRRRARARPRQAHQCAARDHRQTARTRRANPKWRT